MRSLLHRFNTLSIIALTSKVDIRDKPNKPLLFLDGSNITSWFNVAYTLYMRYVINEPTRHY